MKELRDKLQISAGLENLTENLVFQELNNFIEKIKNTPDSQLCICSICLADVAAIVLNDLKPQYCSNFIDKDKSKDYYNKHRLEVREKIAKAFDMVKKNPHHANI